MSSVPAPSDPRERVISITVAVISLVLSLPIVAMVVTILLRHGLDITGVGFLIPPLALFAISVTILFGLRRGRVFRWLGGGWHTVFLLLLISVLAGVMKEGSNAIERMMVARWGVRPQVADLLMLLVIIAGGLVFAIYWRRASAARDAFVASQKPPLPAAIPAGPWRVVEATQDGQLLLARVHMGLDSIVGHPAYPFRVGIATHAIEIVDNGMPTPEENRALQGLETQIQQALEVDREAVLVVVITSAGVKEWVFYTSQPEATEHRMQALAPTVHTHKLQMVIERDDEWTLYREFAHPSSMSQAEPSAN